MKLDKKTKEGIINIKNENILSIDIGGSKLMAGIIDNNGNILASQKVFLDSPITEKYLKVSIENITDKLMSNESTNQIKYIGVAVPGLADKKNGTLIYAPYSGIRNFPIRKILEKKFKVPVYVENDANACAIGEMIYGSCQGIDNFIWITVSNGVGGAIVLGKDIYQGWQGAAGEIGHIVVEENGYQCGCGNKGCLEVYAAGPAIIRRYMKNSRGKIKKLTAKKIAEAAKKGDSHALDVYRQTGYYLGKAISYAINLLNPAKIVLGGGISMDISLILPEIKRVVKNMVFRESYRNLIIEKTSLSYEAALIGAAVVAKIRNGEK